MKPGFGPPVEQTLTAGKADYRIVLDVDGESDNAPPPPPRAPEWSSWASWCRT